MLDVIAVEHEKLRLLQSSQGVALDRADAVEPANMGTARTTVLKYIDKQDRYVYFWPPPPGPRPPIPYPRLMRRVCAGKPGGTASSERKVQWTSLAW